jgi:hypothetical protein
MILKMKNFEKCNLRDVTFLIPIRLDSIVRLENLLLTIDALYRNFETNIIILEASSYDNGILKRLLNTNSIDYYHIEDNDPIFHRTKYLNIMARKVKTDFAAIWDADIIIEYHQITNAVVNLREHHYDIAFPYDGRFCDMTDIIRKYYIINKDLDFLKRNEAKMKLLYGTQMIGGAIIVNIQKYIEAGMENESFYGWGQEDNERFYRWKNLNFRIYRSRGSLYHLSHPRNINGTFKSPEYATHAINMVAEVVNSTKEEILKHINN